jgi:hypothetical protein
MSVMNGIGMRVAAGSLEIAVQSDCLRFLFLFKLNLTRSYSTRTVVGACSYII